MGSVLTFDSGLEILDCLDGDESFAFKVTRDLSVGLKISKILERPEDEILSVNTEIRYLIIFDSFSSKT